MLGKFDELPLRSQPMDAFDNMTALKRIDDPLADVLSGALEKLSLEFAGRSGGAPRCVVCSDYAGAQRTCCVRG